MNGDRFKSNMHFKEEVYKVADGEELFLDIYGSKATGTEKHPVSLYIHGGGWIMGDRTFLRKDPVWKRILCDLLEQNYIVIGADYRLSKNDAKFPAQLEDCKDAVRWIRNNAAKYFIDTDRINVWGHSSGGHLSLMAALTPDDSYIGDKDLASYSSAVESAVSWFGPTELISWANDINKPQWVNDLIFRFIGGTPEEACDRYREASPYAYLDGQPVRLMLIHGEQDRPVAVSQSEMFYELGKTIGKDMEFIRVKNAGHGSTEFIKENNEPCIDEVIERMESFISGDNK